VRYQGEVRHHPGFLRHSDVLAFAEGRRLREQAERHRRRYQQQQYRWSQHHAYRQQHGGRRPDTRLHPLLILLALPSLAVFAVLGGLLALFAFGTGILLILNAFPLVLLGGGTFLVVRHQVRRKRALRRGAAAGVAPIPARRPAPPRPDLVWARARERFHRLRAEYARFECDPMEVLRLPALADVKVASTERFIDAFAEAQALESDAFPGPEHGHKFVGAVDRAERAWRAARDAAERIRLSNLGPAERATVERVIKLLTTARDSDSEPERLAAYARARSELTKLDAAGIVHVPLPAQAALEVSARGQLPADPATLPNAIPKGGPDTVPNVVPADPATAPTQRAKDIA
jgi:hypothetical protein